MSVEPLAASEVRARLLDEHEQIRAQLAILDQLAPQAGPIVSAWALRRYGSSLLRRLTAHLDLEDALLVPALRRADPSGEARASHLERHHQEQRQELLALITELGEPGVSAAAVAADLRELAASLRADMAYEERDLLGHDVLRDNLVGVEVEAG